VIYIDSRESLPTAYSTTGTEDFIALFSSHRTHPPVSARLLPAGDFAFAGHSSLQSLVGIERKTLKGLFKDKRDGRLAGEQLPKLFDHYDPQLVFLLIESDYRTDPATGHLEEYFPLARRWMPSKLGSQHLLGKELDSFTTTLSVMARLTVHFTRNPQETVEYVCNLYDYFQSPLDKRHDHLALHIPQERAHLAKAGTVRRMVAALTGVGWERSFAVAERVKRVYCGGMAKVDIAGNVPCCLVHMEPLDWMKFDGFGKILSGKVVEELRGKMTMEVGQ
jgi:ERCC4-type nuclease